MVDRNAPRPLLADLTDRSETPEHGVGLDVTVSAHAVREAFASTAPGDEHRPDQRVGVRQRVG